MTVTVPEKSIRRFGGWRLHELSCDQANARPMEVLIDHAHCERKAAGSAVQMMFRYLCEPGPEGSQPSSEEELEHFEQVLTRSNQRPLSGTLALVGVWGGTVGPHPPW